MFTMAEKGGSSLYESFKPEHTYRSRMHLAYLFRAQTLNVKACRIEGNPPTSYLSRFSLLSRRARQI